MSAWRAWWRARSSAQPLGAQLGVGGWSQQPAPAVDPEPGGGLGEPTGRSGLKRPHRRRPAGEGGRPRQHGLAGRIVQGQGPAVAGRGRQARAQRLELVVEALLEDLAVGDQPASVTDRPYQGIDGVGGGWPPSALTGQPDQRRAVAVVGLVAPPAKLDSGRLGL
jgi:hypothetical protein